MATKKPRTKDTRGAATHVQQYHPVTKRPVCGAKTRAGRVCLRDAGWGTNHVGFGKCKTHFGNTPAVSKAANRMEVAEVARTILGGQIDIDPTEALLFLIRRTAGMLGWLDQKIAEMEDENEVWQDIGSSGENVISTHKVESVWIKIHGDERDRLARYCKMALDAGVNERQVALAEEQGMLLAGAIRDILTELNLTPAQQSEAPSIVRRILEKMPKPNHPTIIDTTATEG